MGDLDVLGEAMLARGAELFVFGQYGNERWSATGRAIRSPRPPAGLASFERELPSLLRSLDLLAAHVEEKGLAVAVHTRRLPAPDESFERLLAPMGELAAVHGLVLEPGRHVIEVRSPGMNKGYAVRAIAEEQEVAGFFFAGDDLGDVEAFEALAELRDRGVATFGVCSASAEQSVLEPMADAVVAGPDGVTQLLAAMAGASPHPA